MSHTTLPDKPMQHPKIWELLIGHEIKEKAA